MSRTLLLILTFSFAFIFCSHKLGQQKRLVYDFEYILDSNQTKQLTLLYSTHEKKTTNEIVLITTSDFGDDSTIEKYSQSTFNRIGIGKKGINNGVLIVYSGANRQVRIHLGYGTEKVMTNEIAKTIIATVMIPHFKNAQAFEGIWKGSKAIIEFLEKPENKIPKK